MSRTKKYIVLSSLNHSAINKTKFSPENFLTLKYLVLILLQIIYEQQINGII